LRVVVYFILPSARPRYPRARITRAQSYPSRPVRLIAGLAAGGGQDIVARLMGQWLSKRLGRQFIVEPPSRLG
jgi:tripartite-type tricarboxylate transporter receptor subunit TctC